MGSKKNNLVDVKSIMWLLERFLKNATDKERAYIGLETNRIFLSLQSDSKPQEPELEPIEPEPTDLSDLHARLQITEVREAINSKRVKEGLIPFV
jgi:hypothetical protein